MNDTPHIEDPATHGGDFGAYYPTGSVVLAFPDAEAAMATRSALLTGGYDDAECRFLDCEAMQQAMAHNLEHGGVLASLGSSQEMMARYRDLATEGCAFLIVRAASKAESDRLMRVVRRGPFALAQKYHTLAIEDIR